MTMKKKCLLLLGIFSFGLSHAQVGINTQSPQGILHIDPQENTTTLSGYEDDVIVTNRGYLGIGTMPDSRLHIKTEGTVNNPIPGFILKDGNQGEGKVLTSENTSGDATWKTISTLSGKYWTRGTGVDLTLPAGKGGNNPIYNSTGAQINLTEGRWVVSIILHATTSHTIFEPHISTICTTLSDAQTSGNLSAVASSDLESSPVAKNILWVGGPAGNMVGKLVIKNTLASKTYYIMVGDITNLSGGTAGTIYYSIGMGYGEDSVSAFRIP